MGVCFVEKGGGIDVGWDGWFVCGIVGVSWREKMGRFWCGEGVMDGLDAWMDGLDGLDGRRGGGREERGE